MPILIKEWGLHNRWGNYSYLYAGLSSIAKKAGNSLYLPENYFAWKYMSNPPLVDKDMKADELFHIRQSNYTKEELDYMVDYFTVNKDKNINVNIGSNLQSELWFEDDKDYVRSLFDFKPEVTNTIKEKYKHVFTKEVIGISIRRGDFVNHGVFFQIPLQWYLDALEKEFPNWKDCNILFFSDNIEELKTIFKGENFFFAEKNDTHTHIEKFKFYHGDPMEQFILGTMCNHMIGSQSTFSWWMMWLINQKGGKVVHSGKNLSPYGDKQFYNPDYYPKDWTLYPVK